MVLKDGTTIQGAIDEIPMPGEPVLILYDVFIRDKRNWKSYNDCDTFSYFYLIDIKEIWSPDLVKLNFKRIELSAIRDLWIDPSFEVIRSINCEGGWRTNKPHSPKCDAIIHDTLKKLYTFGIHGHRDYLKKEIFDDDQSENEEKDFRKNIWILINTMIKNGINIPGGNEEY